MAVAGIRLRQNDEVDLQALVPPVRVRLDHLAHQVQGRRIRNPQQDDGQVAGDSVGPESGLAFSIAGDEAGTGTQPGVGVGKETGHSPEQLGVGLRRLQFVKQDLTVHPRQFEYAGGQVAGRNTGPAASQCRSPIRRHAPDGIDGDGLPRLQAYRAPDDHHGIESRRRRRPGDPPAMAAGLAVVRPRPRKRERSVSQLTPSETGWWCTIIPWKNKGQFSCGRPGPARADDGGLGGQGLRFEEQAVECRLFGGIQAVEHRHLGVGGDLDMPLAIRQVGDDQPPQLDVLFGGHGHSHVHLNVFSRGAKLGDSLGELGFVVVELAAGRLRRRRPERAGIQIAHVQEGAPMVARGVFLPPRQGQVLPTAGPAPGRCDHDVVAAIGEQMDLGDRRVGRRERSQRGVDRLRRVLEIRLHAGHVDPRAHLRQGDPLLQEQQGGANPWVAQEPPVHGLSQQRLVQRQQAHSAVVGHVAADQGKLLAGGYSAGSVVGGLVEAVSPEEPSCGHRFQVGAGGARVDHQGQDRGIGRHDQIIVQPLLESQSRDAEGPVLVGLLRVELAVATFGDAPRHPLPPSIANLPRDRLAAGLFEQGRVVVGHEQQRHQVLEHGAAPGYEHGGSAARGELAPQMEPVLKRHLAAGDAQETAQPGLRREQVVEARVSLVRYRRCTRSTGACAPGRTGSPGPFPTSRRTAPRDPPSPPGAERHASPANSSTSPPGPRAVRAESARLARSRRDGIES